MMGVINLYFIVIMWIVKHVILQDHMNYCQVKVDKYKYTNICIALANKLIF
jgi:hypothetical protein